MSDPGLPPAIPVEFQVYNSYDTDPKFQKYFTYAWVAFLSVCVLFSLPALARRFRSGSWRTGWAGIEERMHVVNASEGSYDGHLQKKLAQSASKDRHSSFQKRSGGYLHSLLQSTTYPSVPLPPLKIGKWIDWRYSYIPITIGQFVIIGGYTAAVMVCLFKDAELYQNSNRAGFLALAQLTPLFVLVLPSSPILFLLPSISSSLHLNIFHRWAGRLVFLFATVHGGLWVNQFLTTNQASQIDTDKVKRGFAAWVLLLSLAVTSIGPIRKRAYNLFWTLHLLSIIGFFAAVSYHTPYSKPWIWPPIALFTWDFAVRIFRHRIKDAILIPLDESMTMVHIPDCDFGWRPTQHVFIRVLAGGSILESHPLSITNAPPSLRLGSPRGITFYASDSGDWSKKLNVWAKEGNHVSEIKDGIEYDDEDMELQTLVSNQIKNGEPAGTTVKVVLDGPYGGIKLDMANYGEVVIIAGGSGITFALGAVEECFRVAEVQIIPVVQRINLVWAVRSASILQSMAPTLAYLEEQSKKFPDISLAFNVHLTRQDDVSSELKANLPTNIELQAGRPNVTEIIKSSQHGTRQLASEDSGVAMSTGLAVIACGPESIVTQSRNAVARLGVADRAKGGGVDFHGEGYFV